MVREHVQANGPALLRTRRRWPLAGIAAAALSLFAPPLSAQKAANLGKEKARIYYDARMIPHVFGDTDEAAFYGLGFHHMLEFPVGTLNLLWLHSGRMAEIAGESYLDEDRLIRLWDVPAVAARHRQELAAAQLLPLIQAYVRGIEAGRAWWREPAGPANSPRFAALLGAALEAPIDPVPDYMNQAFSPFGSWNDPTVPQQMQRVLERLFDEDLPITADHVLRFGAALNSFFLLHGNPVELDVLPDDEPDPPLPVAPAPLPSLGVRSFSQSTKFSNGWLVGLSATTGGALSLCDNHVALNELHVRPYLVQIAGDHYEATGLCMPGIPGVFEGFNDSVSWLVTAPAGAPVAHNNWQATLEPSPDPEDLRFTFTGPGFTDEVALEKVEELVPYFDPLSGATSSYLDTRYYVPRHPAENPALGFDRYPVVPLTADPPVPGGVVRFEQAAFSYERSPWEYVLRFGCARNAKSDVDAVLAGGLLVYGNGSNLMVADRAGSFRYLYMARIPIQGSEVPPANYDEQAILDGSRLDWRWKGFHPVSDLPSIGPVDVSMSPQAWINDNVTPDEVEPYLFDEADLASYPAYMVSQTTISSWRQVRAEELLRPPVLLSQLASEKAATDKQDVWMHWMWPFFKLAAGQAPLGTSAQAQLLLQWIDEYRTHDEQDQPNPSYDFVAHVFSQATVYGVLLRSHYLDELAEEAENAALTPEQASFGTDPRHPLFEDPSSFDYAGYAPNIRSMAKALERVAFLWKAGTGPSGLVNQALLAGWSPGIPGDPWGDPRYDVDIAPSWRPTIGGQKVTRWGHVDMLCLTPHYLPPPKRQYLEDAQNRGGDKYLFIRGFTYLGLNPPLLDTLPYANLKLPFFEQQQVAVRPVGGSIDSLFRTQHLPIFDDPRPKDYQESVYDWDPSAFFDWHPETAGSQCLFSVHLRPNAPAQGRFLLAIGATEITAPDLLGNGELDYQERFAPTQDFVDGTWGPIVTQEAALGPPRYTLVLFPLTPAGDRKP